MTAREPEAALDVLSLWERGSGLAPLDRNLALAEAVGRASTDLLRAPVGSTNRALLDLRQGLLGAELPATAECPGCGERVEFSVGVEQFPAACGPAEGEFDGAHWRAPTPADLFAAADEPDPPAALRARCLGGDPAPSPELEHLLEQADPLAETLLDLRCPACGGCFGADLDIGAFVWQEIEAEARRLLLQIDSLARVYGWTEAEVLALSPARREAYLRMTAGGLP